MGYDAKYGKVTTEFGEIPDDEPVIVFRAQDQNLVDLLDVYEEICIDFGSPEHHVNLIRETRQQIAQWQKDHPDRVRIPNSDSYMKRIGKL